MRNGAASSETVVGPASNLVRIRRRVGSASAAKIRSSAGADVRAGGKLTIGLTIGHPKVPVKFGAGVEVRTCA